MTANVNKFLLFAGAVLLVTGILFPLFTSWVVMNRDFQLEQSFNAIASDLGLLLIGLGVLAGASAFFYNYRSIRTAYAKFVGG